MKRYKPVCNIRCAELSLTVLLCLHKNACGLVQTTLALVATRVDNVGGTLSISRFFDEGASVREKKNQIYSVAFASSKTWHNVEVEGEAHLKRR